MSAGFSLNHHISDVVQDYLKELELKCQNKDKLLGLATGYDELDKRLGGLKAGDVTLIGARPAMGKTSFAFNIARHVAASSDDKCVVYISMELPPKEFALKMLALQASVPFYQIRYGEEIEEKFDKIIEAGRALGKLPIYYVGDVNWVDDIQKTLVHAEKQVGLVIVDYLQSFGKTYPSQEDLSAEMLELKALAVRFDVPVVVLSQLSRKLESRADKRPLLADIRGFSHNQNAADNILFLYREHYYIWLNEPIKGKRETDEHYQMRFCSWKDRCKQTEKLCEVIIAKNSNNHYGTVKLWFDFATGLFAPWDDDLF